MLNCSPPLPSFDVVKMKITRRIEWKVIFVAAENDKRTTLGNWVLLASPKVINCSFVVTFFIFSTPSEVFFLFWRDNSEFSACLQSLDPQVIYFIKSSKIQSFCLGSLIILIEYFAETVLESIILKFSYPYRWI